MGHSNHAQGSGRRVGRARARVAASLAAAAVAAAAGSALAPAVARAGGSAPLTKPPLVHNPIANPKTHKPISCPDPSVIRVPNQRWQYYMACTSDFDRNAFPIWGSQDGARWTRLGSVFPSGMDPSWAIPAGRSHGRYWAPDLHYFNHEWVLYYAAELTPDQMRTLKPAPQGRFAIGVAVTRNLLSGHWVSWILHYSGQFNDVPADAHRREVSGGVIDPGEFENPVTHQLYLVYAKQSNQLWLGTLTANGLRLDPDVQRIVIPSTPWECANLAGTCTVEGPVGYFYQNVAYILYSASSTWAGTYAVGVAASADPLVVPFSKDPSPILSSSSGLLGPGGTSDPTIGPDGDPIIYFHTLQKPDPGHVSGVRYLTAGRFGYVSAASASLSSSVAGQTVGISWPQISDGMPKKYTTLTASTAPAG